MNMGSYVKIVFLLFALLNTNLALSQTACGGFTGNDCSNESQFCDFGANCGRDDYPGVCREKPRVCTQEFDPVCGCDGETYSNACSAHHDGISIAYTGRCGSQGGGSSPK